MSTPRDPWGTGIARRAHKLIQFFLENETFTRAEVVAFSGLHFSTVDRLFKTMRRKDSVFRPRIVEYQPDSRNCRTVPVYAFSPGKDVGRPKPLTAVQRMQRTRANKKRKAEVLAQQTILAMARPVEEEA